MATEWMDGASAVCCPKCDGKTDFQGRDLGMLRILPTGNGRLADVHCPSCDTGYRVVCPDCWRYMICLKAKKGFGQDRSSSSHGEGVAGRPFFKCERCERLMDCGSSEIELDEKRKDDFGWPLWYGVFDRWRSVRGVWRLAFGTSPATKARRVFAIAVLPFRLTALSAHAAVALPLFAAARLLNVAFMMLEATLAVCTLSAVAWVAWRHFMG